MNKVMTFVGIPEDIVEDVIAFMPVLYDGHTLVVFSDDFETLDEILQDMLEVHEVK